MAGTDTWRYGLLDAAECAREAGRDDSPYEGRSWDDWDRDYNKVVSEARVAGYGPIVDVVINTYSHGRERDTFVSVLAGHLRARSWG